MDKRQAELREKYGASEQGNFYVLDSIGVPHPYCITPKHVAVAADHHCGILGKEAIVDAEERGARCGICKGKLAYAEHEQALLVECNVEIKGADGKAVLELQAYLLKIKAQAERDHYAGFAFKQSVALAVSAKSAS